jgi:SLT domain-containing protein/phage-related protein
MGGEKMPEISAKMTLDANGYINAMKQSIQYTDDFRKTVEEAKQSINLISMTKVQVKIEININKTLENIAETKKQLDGIKKNIQIMIAAKNSASNSIKKIGKEVKSLVSRPFQVVFKAKDEVSKVIKSITDKVNGLKASTGKIGKFAFDNTIGAAAESEQREVVMKHFIGNNNPMSSSQDIQKMNNDYISQLKSQINAAPFLPSEFMSVGQKAVNITNGNTKEGMDLVKLSENMAALNPGKSLMDAMNALSDLKKGETKNMEGFGVKISQNDISKAGGIDNYFKTQINDKGSLGKAFAGGANELSKTVAGKWSIVIENLKTIGTNFGKAFLPVINKVLTPLANFLDKNSDKFTKFGESIVKVGGKIGNALTPVFEKMPGIIDKYVMPTIKFIQNISSKYIIPAISSIVSVVKQYGPPIIQAISGFMVKMSPILKKYWGIIQEYIIPIIQDLWGKVQDAMPGIQSLIESAFKVGAKVIEIAVDRFGKVAPVIKDMYDVISPILDGVIGIFNNVADAIKTAVNWLDTWNGKKAEDNSPKLNTTPGQYDLITGKKNPTTYNFYTGKKEALGTTYFEGGSTWVGENGPEILKLPGGSKIFSNRESNNMMNAGKTAKQSQANLANPSKAKAPQMDLTAITSSAKSISPQVETWGKDIPDNLAKGIKNNTKSVTDSVTLMATKIRELIHFSVPDKGPLSDFDTYSVDMMKNFGTGIKDNTKSVVDPTTNMSTGVKNVYSALSTQSNSYGQQIVQQLGTGIQSSSSNLVDIVKTLTDKVIETFKSGFGIHSPSVVMYQMGGHLLQGLMNGMNSKDMGGFVQEWIGSMTSAAGGAVSGNLSGWISAAMAMTGVSSDWFSPLATLIQHESGGDPMSINLWDSNAAAGHPSKGLMQLIDENMAEHHLPGMNDIWNPIDNIAAGIRLIQHDYGTIYNTPGIRAMAQGKPYVGYETGTTYATQGYHWVGEKGPELMKMHGGEKVVNNKDSMKIADGKPFIIQKLADSIVVREDADIDKIATALAKKLKIAAQNS